MTDEKTYLSREKFNELEKELDFLKTTRRKEVAEKLEYAKSLGDLSENAEYHEAREDQAHVEQRIAELETMLKNAEVVDAHHSDTVEVGSVVHVRKKGEKEKRKYQIVGSEEADTDAGKISHLSPLGEALMGKKKGDEASFRTAKGEIQYVIIDIE